MRLLFEAASWLLPHSHRARWREESLALLLGVQGRRRWRYTLDLVVKVPVLAWQLHHRPAIRWPRWGAVLAGFGLLIAAVGTPGAFLVSPALGEDTAEALLLLAPLGLAAYITGRTMRTKRRLATAVPVILFCAFGPLVAVGILAAGPAVPGWLAPAVTIAGYAALAGPGAWLAVRSSLAIRHRERPVPLHAFGVVAGGAFVVDVATLVWQILSNGNPPLPVLVLMFLGLFAFLITFPVWAAWTALWVITQSMLSDPRRPVDSTR